MNRSLRGRRAGDQTLVIAAALLMATAVWPWIAGTPIPEPQREATKIPEEPVVVGPLPSLESFAATFERPLFSSTRRPPETSAHRSGHGSATRYRLLGLVTVGETRRALLEEGTRRFEVVEGASLDGWTVLRIEQDRVLLSSSIGQSVLKLRRAATAGGAVPIAETPR